MALIQSKQLDPKFTGSFIFSGSNAIQTIGGINSDTLTTTGNISGSLVSTGSFGRVLMTTGRVSDFHISDDLVVTDDAQIGGIFSATGNTIHGNAESDTHTFTGHITASGNISASGTVFADNFQSTGESVGGISFSDDLNLTGDLTASGHISASSTSTASFGKIELDNDIHLNAGTFAISGSSNSTASFGLVKIHAIGGNSPITFTDTIIQQQNIEVAGHITASGNISNVSTTHVTASGNMEVGQYIKHAGDADTFINFTDNRIRFKAGDIGFFDMEKDAGAPYPATINPGGNRINFRVNDRNTNLLLKTDSEAFNVGLYHAGNKKLETVVGGVDITGNITASANISASGNLDVGGKIYSTGDIETKGNITAQQFIVSSSVTYMTQSFSSGSTIFGDSNDDTHQFTGSILSKGSITAVGNIVTQGSITAAQGQNFGTNINDKHEFTGSVVVTGSLNVESGRIFEQGSSVIDHATAMAIVFGG